MASFRQELLQQIERMAPGRIFTFRDLSFDVEKTANVAVLLSEQRKKGTLVRIEKGAYVRPRTSTLGLGTLPVYQDEQIRYLTRKLSGYVTGTYIYNKMGLTEQIATTVTIATPYPVRRFRFKNLDVDSVKAYCNACTDETLVPYLRLLDAIKDIKRIPGTTEQEVYTRIKQQYFNHYSDSELKKIVTLANHYPPRVRKVVADMLGDMKQTVLQREMHKTLHPTTRFNMNYKTEKHTYEPAY